MDAREYLSRKGVGLDRDPDRPNTLEEKAWERARGSGQQRPKSGTPHDWEDWERHHDDLADGAQTLEQKIDKEAHQQAKERTLNKAEESASNHQAERSQAGSSQVEHFTPPSSAPAETASVAAPSKEQPMAEPAGLKIAYLALALLLPPLAVGLTGGGARRVIIALLLTVLAWLPGAIYAFWWLQRR